MSHQQHPLGGSRPAWRAWQSPPAALPSQAGVVVEARRAGGPGLHSPHL